MPIVLLAVALVARAGVTRSGAPGILAPGEACLDWRDASGEARRHVAAHWAAFGVPEGTASVSPVYAWLNGGWSRSLAEDADGRTLASIEVDESCVVQGVSRHAEWRRAQRLPPDLPGGPTAATALHAAWPSLRALAGAGDVLVGVAEGEGFEVWLVRLFEAGHVAFAVARVREDGTVARVRSVEERWVPRAGAMAATVVALDPSLDPLRGW